MAVRAEGSDSVNLLKQKIYEKARIPSSRQRLTFGERRLEDSVSLDSCNILEDSVLHLQVEAGQIVEWIRSIFIKALAGAPLKVKVEAATTVLELKQLCNELQHPVHQQRLIHRGKELRDDESIAQCRIQDESTVHLVLRDIGGMRINITMPQGTITLEVLASDTIKRVKEKIRD